MAITVYSSPKAVIQIDGKNVGFVNNVSFTENITRADIKGIGSLNSQEVPPTGWNGTWQVSEFFVDFSLEGTKALLNRYASKEVFINTLIQGEFPFTIAMFEKTTIAKDNEGKLVTEIDPTGNRKVLLKNCFIESQNFSLAENAVASLASSGRYLTPMTLV